MKAFIVYFQASNYSGGNFGLLFVEGYVKTTNKKTADALFCNSAIPVKRPFLLRVVQAVQK